MITALQIFLFKLLLLVWNLLPVGIHSHAKDLPLPEMQAIEIYRELANQNISRNAFLIAYEGYNRLQQQQLLARDSILTLIDFSKPSYQERFFILDLKNRKVLEQTLVAHGKNTGVVQAQKFSNIRHSNQSSLGFFIAGQTYEGKHGYSLRIRGVENEINDLAYQRAIVIHGAHYVNTEYIKQNGRLGRSFGCPALSYEISEEVINQIKGESCIFIYSPSEEYLERSQMINSSYYSQIIPG